MSTKYKTGNRSEALHALPEITTLAQDVLSEVKYQEAENTARMLLGSKNESRRAKAILKLEIGNHPSRPLWYLWPLLDGLPRYTRDSIRYSGDYLDLLVKELTNEKIGGKARKRSLGSNSKNLQKKVPELGDLATLLVRYCNFLYNPGKHDFSHPIGRSHRFTAREVVLTVYITAELGKRILSFSENAREAVEDDNWYAIGGRWGSSDRLDYYGKRSPPEDVSVRTIPKEKKED